MKTKILDFFDFEKVNTLLEGFYKSTGFVTAILDLEGNVLSQSGWRPICTDFHRVHPETAKKCVISDTVLANKMAEGEKYHFYQCLNGLVDVAVPIIIKGEHIANLFSGQFFFEEPDNSFFQKQATKYGFNQEIYLESLKKVPIFSKEKVKVAMDFLLNLTLLISEMTLQKLEQTLLNKSLSESESLFRKIFEDGATGMVIVGKDFKFLRANRTFCKMTGYPEDELKQLTFAQITHPDDSAKDIQNVKKLIEGKIDVYKTEKRYLKKDGQIFWVQLTVSPIYDSNGGFLYNVAIIVDVSKRKQNELDLTRISRIMENAQEIAHLGSFEYVAADQSTVWSEEEYRIYGLDSNESSPEYNVMLEKCIHPDDAQLLHNTFMSAIKNNKIYELEHRIIRPDGSMRWVYDKAHPFFDENGKLLRYVGATLDVTERKQAEGKLRESEYRYRKIYEDGANGMVVAGKDFKFQMANRTFCQMTGYREEELQQLTFADITHPDDRARDLPHVKKMMAGEIDVYATEKRYLNKNGQTIWVQLTVSPIYDSNGQFLYFIGIIVNVTDRKKAEEILKESYALIKIAGEKAKLGGWNVNIGENRVYWSDEVAAIHERPSGYAPSVEEGINFYAPEWRSKIKKVFANCVGRGIPFDEEMQIITASGKRVWVNTIGEAIRDDKGKIVKVQGAFQDISERKSTEESLRQSEENLAITLNSIGDGVIATDLNGLVVKMNPVAEKLCGWTLTDAAGKPLTEVFKIVNTNSRETAINPVKKVLENGEIVGLANSTLLISKNGTEYQISDSAAPIKNKEGKISGVVLVFSDVTEKYLTAQALKENEERLNLFFNQSLTGFFFMKLEEPIAWNDSVDKEKTLDDVFGNLRVAKVNQAMLNQYLATEDEFLNRTFNEFFAHDLKQGYKVIKELFDRGSLHIDTSELRFDGTQMWVEGDYICLYDSKGSIKGLFGTQHDITERKQAEEQLRKLSRAVEQSPASIILTDTQGNIVYVNPKTLEVTGYELSELLGKNPKIFSAGEKLKEAYNILWQKITSGKEWRGEFHNKKKNGELFWEQASISPILDEKGQITHYLAVKEDITERKQLIEDLIIAKEQAEQSDKLKSAFLANMSHEIRTPMNGILGFTEFLKEPNLSGEKQQKYINIIQKSGTRMLNIINDIVDISKIEAGLMEVDFKELNIAEPIKYIHTFFKPEFEKKGLQFFVKNNINEKEIIIKTDREKIYAILINLIKNAIKYTNEGMIELSYDNKGDFLEFSVKDTGIGIPKDRQEAIFERFIQADISDKMARQGAGLGLSITKAYVEMLGGKIWVESEDENTIIGKKGGSTFYFTIPCNTGPIIKTNGQKTKFTKKIENKVEKLKILIAEDDEASSLYLSMLAEEINSEILMAKDGLEAVEIYKNNPDIDLILMDLQMPHLNGYEATIQIRQLNKKVVIIAQTAFALSYDKQKAMDAGCSDYISKPILKAGFSALIRKYFNKRES